MKYRLALYHASTLSRQEGMAKGGIGGARGTSASINSTAMLHGHKRPVKVGKIPLASGRVLHVVFTQSLSISRGFNARYIFGGKVAIVAMHASHKTEAGSRGTVSMTRDRGRHSCCAILVFFVLFCGLTLPAVVGGAGADILSQLRNNPKMLHPSGISRPFTTGSGNSRHRQS